MISFGNIGFNIKFQRKYNLRQSRFCFRLSKAFLNEILMNEANYFIFRRSSSRRKAGVYSFKLPPGEGEDPKKYLCL